MKLATSHRLLTAAAATGALLAVVPAAHAAELSPLKPCYVSVNRDERQPLDTFATGFAPHAEVDVTVGDSPQRAIADAYGNVDLRVAPWIAPYRRRGQAPFTVTVTDPANPLVDTVSATSLVTALSVRVRPRRAATSDRVRFRGRGFTADRRIWGHYIYRGQVRKTVRLARRPDGPCGRFSVRRRQIPLRHPHPGVWTLQIDQQRRWSPRPDSVYVPVRITVRRVVAAR